ncbi:uncharacterized protein [Anabrus simplex]
MNFSYALQLTSAGLKNFFLPKLRYENIVSIDLSSCYWLPSADIYTCLKKMRNLKIINVIDTRLSDIHLCHILKHLPKLTHLSCSKLLTEGNPVDYPHIEYLRIESAGWMFFSLWRMIKRFPNLRELWVKCSRVASFPTGSYVDLDSFKLPYLHTLALQLNDFVIPPWNPALHDAPLGMTRFLEIILAACAENSGWKVYWIDTKCILNEVRIVIQDSSQVTAFLPPCGYEFEESPVDMMNLSYMGYMESLPFKRWLLEIDDLKLSHLFLPRFLADVVTLPSTLKHLYITGCWSWLNLRTSSTLENLHSLSLPFCLFINPVEFSPENMFPLPGPSHINKRVSRISTDPWPYGRLTMFIKMCPNLQHLKLVGCYSESTCQSVSHDYASLGEICSWRNLRSLSLEYLGVPVTSILVKIAKACPLIETVNFTHLQGPSRPGNYIVYLKEALQYWKYLKRLSLREKELILLPSFLDALQKNCPLMEKLVLISHGGETAPLSVPVCLSLIDSFSSMVMFYVSLLRITKDMASKFKKEVEKRYKESRPALWAKIEKYNSDNEALKDCPLIHLNDMVTQCKPFGIFPDCNC